MLFMAWVILSIVPDAHALQAIPTLESPVMDMTDTLTSEQQSTLTQQLSTFAQTHGSQIVVLIVDSTAPEDIAQYSIRLAEAWKIGREKEDDGVILIVAKHDRKIRIEVGRGLEGAIPDIIAKRIITEILAPAFRLGDYFGGIEAASQQLMRLIHGESLPAPSKGPSVDERLFQSFPLLILAAIFSGMILRGIFGTFLGSAFNGALVAGCVGFLGGAMTLMLFAGVAGFLFTMAMSGRGGDMVGHYPNGYGGFGHGGYHGGDVFRGGGGTFGGGGASGDW